MPRTYGTTNVAPYATAPAVGPSGDTYYNTTNKALYISDGTQWNAIQAGGGGGGAPYAPVTGTAPPPASPTISPPTGLLWVDTSTTPSWSPATGPGVPPGGATGSYLQKRSTSDYDTQWASPANLLYYQTIPAPTVVSSPYPIAHNLGTTYVHVQMWDSVTGLMVGAQVQVVNANSVQISVSQNMPNAVNVVVMGTANLTPPINPADIASKSYVDARTPNLPPAVTSGTTTQTFTDALGDVWVAKNGVNGGSWKRARDVLIGSCYLNTGFTMGTSQVALPFDTQGIDDYGMWNGSNGFNLPINGVWRLECQATASFTTTGNTFAIWGWFGPSQVFFSTQTNGATGFGGYAATCYAARTFYVTTQQTAVIQYRSSIAQNMTGGGMSWATVCYVGTH